MTQRITLLRKVPYVLLLCLASAAVAQAQNWSGVLAPSRATDWTTTGLPATLPDGETTSNPWTPPTRTTICTTITTATFSGMSSSNYVAPTAINSAITGCGQGHVVHVVAGTYYFSGTILLTTSGVTLRLDDGAKFIFNTAPAIEWYNGSGATFGVDWTGAPSYAQGASVIYLPTISGLTAGTSILEMRECADGLSGGYNACTGTNTDGGGMFVCNVTSCSDQGSTENTALGVQTEITLVTSINANGVNGCAAGAGNYCVGISPGLLTPNWNASQDPNAAGLNPTWGAGLEGGTIDDVGNPGGDTFLLSNCYACWMVGTRAVGGQGGTAFFHESGDALHCLLANDYLWPRVNFTMGGDEIIVLTSDTDTLLINNIFQAGPPVFTQAASLRDVFAYNYARDCQMSGGSGSYQFTNCIYIHHHPGDALTLLEGNQMAEAQDDSIHGTNNLNTWFRNALIGEPPYILTNTRNKYADAEGFSRFDNMIGNVIGDPQITLYQTVAPTHIDQPASYELGVSNGPTVDDLTPAATYRWGNYDVISAATRWCGAGDPNFANPPCSSNSEVPNSLTGNAAPFSQSTPSSHTLPASFFLPTTPSWWTVCTNYPTCSTSQTPPFPPIGPDVTGGSIYGDFRFSGGYAGHANNIPAYIAWKNLPIDTYYQKSYGISASSWSAGTETLTLSSTPGDAPLGEFQISEGVCAGTYLVTNAVSTTSIQFALASNPGDPNACTSGTLLWPDVRQFGSTVYPNDSGGGGTGSNPPAAPTGLTAVVQ